MSQTRRALGGLRWVGASRLLTQCVTWGMTIFTMRALQPSDYGIVATAGLFMILAGLLLDAGLTIVLISRRELPLELQGAAASAVLGLSFILALGIAVVAPAGAGRPARGGAVIGARAKHEFPANSRRPVHRSDSSRDRDVDNGEAGGGILVSDIRGFVRTRP